MSISHANCVSACSDLRYFLHCSINLDQLCPRPFEETPREPDPLPPLPPVQEPRRSYAVTPLGEPPKPREDDPAAPAEKTWTANFHVTNLGTLLDVLA